MKIRRGRAEMREREGERERERIIECRASLRNAEPLDTQNKDSF